MAPEEKPKQEKEDATLPEDWEKIAGGAKAPDEDREEKKDPDEAVDGEEKKEPPAFM